MTTSSPTPSEDAVTASTQVPGGTLKDRTDGHAASPAESVPSAGTQSFAADYRLGFSRSLPIMLGYAPVAFAFGVLATQMGMPAWLAVAMSALVFAGSGQFIAISMWFSGAGFLSTTVAIFVTHLRYVLMAVALAPHVRDFRGLSRFIFGWQITDELFAVHIAAFKQGWKARKAAIFSATTLAQLSWTGGTFAGALCGGMVADVRPLGLDYALAGMFIALLVPQCVDRLQVLVALLAAFFSVALYMAGFNRWNVVVATLLAATIGTLLLGRRERFRARAGEESADRASNATDGGREEASC